MQNAMVIVVSAVAALVARVTTLCPVGQTQATGAPSSSCLAATGSVVVAVVVVASGIVVTVTGPHVSPGLCLRLI